MKTGGDSDEDSLFDEDDESDDEESDEGEKSEDELLIKKLTQLTQLLQSYLVVRW